MSGVRGSNPSIPAPAVAGSLDAAFKAQRDRIRYRTRNVAGPVAIDWERLSSRAESGLNFTLALIALVLLAPVLLVVALAVRLSSRGPVLYTQERVGLDRRWRQPGNQNHRRYVDVGGKPFTIYKFRTMIVDAERESGAVWASPSDPRVTPIGSVLRRYRLDELPQFINVLKGEMNIVGPRPERPQIFAQLRGEIREYPLRQRTKPGITGWAQIHHHYDQSIEDVRTKVRYDLEYIHTRSMSGDLRIMLRTIPVVLFRRGGW